MKLYRLMKADADDWPLVGTASMCLGARPTDPSEPNKRADVRAVLGTDRVFPGGGGLSCYTDPAAIGIRGKTLFLWSIDSGELSAGILPVRDRDPHWLLEPDRPMTLSEFQTLLAGTRPFWRLEPRGVP